MPTIACVNRTVATVLIVGALELFAQSASAQLRPPPIVDVSRDAESLSGTTPAGRALLVAPRLLETPRKPGAPDTHASWYSPLASLAVPGSGQALLRQQRSLAYVVAEGFLWIRAVRENRNGNTARTHYQTLASEVARAGFGSARPVGPWDYYETLEEYESSGAYDLRVGGKFTPETDTVTYNGAQWQAARRIYWNDANVPPAESSPEYQRAIAFYNARAAQGSFQWSWRNFRTEQLEYIGTIGESNRSHQQLVSTLSLIAANHLVSMVDAYINVRLRRNGGAGMVGASVKTELRQLGPSTGLQADRRYGATFNISVPFANW